jgi:hypothetical protein
LSLYRLDLWFSSLSSGTLLKASVPLSVGSPGLPVSICFACTEVLPSVPSATPSPCRFFVRRSAHTGCSVTSLDWRPDSVLVRLRRQVSPLLTIFVVAAADSILVSVVHPWSAPAKSYSCYCSGHSCNSSLRSLSSA